MSRITLLTGNALCHNPRVIKSASLLAAAGHNVIVLGAWVDPSLKERDQELLRDSRFTFLPVLDIAGTDIGRRCRRAVHRSRSAGGQWLFKYANLENRWQLGYCAPELYRAARRMGADLFIAHSELGLAAASMLLSAGERVGVDMEDWFSEDLLPAARKDRPIRLLRDLERHVLRQGAHATCPSRCMSEALARTYECSPPAVMYNAFRWSDRGSLDHRVKDKRDLHIPSIHWYSQTIGPGRGLEDLLAALPKVQYGAEIHLRGNPVVEFGDWLSARVPEDWRHRVFVHGLVSNQELLSRISEHDIGFAGEMKYCRSRDLTVTNKIMEYLLAGLAVVASDTAGQQEVAERAQDAVFLYPSGDAAALAAQINALLESPEILKQTKAAALRAAQQTFCWEEQEAVLLQSIIHALNAPAPYLRSNEQDG